MLKEENIGRILETVGNWEAMQGKTIIIEDNLSLQEVLEITKAATPVAIKFAAEEVALGTDDEVTQMADQYAKKIQKAYKKLETAKANVAAWENHLNSLSLELLETQSALTASLQNDKAEATLEAEVEIANMALQSLRYRIDTAKAEIQRHRRSIKSLESNIHQYERLMDYWLERKKNLR